MATNLPSCFSIQFLEQLLKFLVNFTLSNYVKSQRSYGFLITKELIFWLPDFGLKDHFSASLNIFTFQDRCHKTPIIWLGSCLENCLNCLMQFTELKISFTGFKDTASFLSYFDQEFARSKICSHAKISQNSKISNVASPLK